MQVLVFGAIAPAHFFPVVISVDLVFDSDHVFQLIRISCYVYFN